MKYLILLLILFIGCTDANRTKKTLESSGFTDIETGGFNLFACGKDDNFATDFTAKNANGQKVSGTVCCGILKGCTVRF